MEQIGRNKKMRVRKFKKESGRKCRQEQERIFGLTINSNYFTFRPFYWSQADMEAQWRSSKQAHTARA